MTLAKARANASAKAKHIFNTGVNATYNCRNIFIVEATGVIHDDRHMAIVIYL